MFSVVVLATLFGVRASSAHALIGGSTDSSTNLRTIEIRAGGLVFDARAAGPENGPLVLLLHGFPETSYSYVAQLEHLGGLGYYAVAPDQRGYSPGARPKAVELYGMNYLVGDVIGIADALGRERFHLVGHDWGGAVAWAFASSLPHRLESLTVFSTPHYAVFQAGGGDAADEQADRSSYFSIWGQPGAEKAMLANDAEQLRAVLGGLPAESVEKYLEVLSDPKALRSALHWYGALLASRQGSGSAAPPPPAPPISVPTLYIWGEDDPAFGRLAAEATAEYVTGPYRFVALPGVGHWVAETATERVNELLAGHLSD